MKLVLFDIDGTLMLGFGAGTRAMTRAGRLIFGERFDLAGVMIGGGLDPVIFAEAARRIGIDEAGPHHDRFRDLYLMELAKELELMRDHPERRPKLLPGVTALLAELANRRDVMIGLVTGNYQRAVPIKFAAVGLGVEAFVTGAFGDCGPTRPELVRLALERASARAGKPIDPRQTFVIGDTPRDVHCALANDCVCLAVGTGAHSLAELQAAGAHHVSADLSDPNTLLALLA